MGVKEIESERFDYRNVVQPDMDAASAKWESVTRSCFKDNVSPPPSEFATTFQLKARHAARARAARRRDRSDTRISLARAQGGVKGAKLAEYRDQWTHDTPLGSKMRFSTTSMNADKKVDPSMKFGSRQTRALPGTPLAVEVRCSCTACRALCRRELSPVATHARAATAATACRREWTRGDVRSPP